MDEKKMIPCIYMSMGRAVTGFGQKTIFEDGDLLKLAREYGNTGADELLIFDFSSNDAEHDEAIGWIKKDLSGSRNSGDWGRKCKTYGRCEKIALCGL